MSIPLYRVKLAVALGLLLISAVDARLTQARELTIYVAPQEQKSGTGLKPAEPVGSLAEALRAAKANMAEDVTGVTVQVASGTYKGQRLRLNGTPGDVPFHLQADPKASSRPKFDGGGKGVWFVLKSTKHDTSPVRISGLEVFNYVSAVSLSGQRKSEDLWNGGNEITDNVFAKIGQGNAKSRPATAAVSLVNSRNNKVVGNTFKDIRNVKDCNLLHAIYIAHYSANNIISDNVFDGGCGAAIKVRDASHANKIVRNKFVNQQAEAFQDSFCDKSRSSMCTKSTAECPSWDTVFENNTMAKLPKMQAFSASAGKAPIKQPKLTVVKGQAQPPGCPTPPGQPRRIKSLENKYVD